MKLTVFGSTGKVGRQIVEQALEQGHEVAAFTRSPEKYKMPAKNLQLIRGDVLDPVSVESAIRGRDCVLCALGMPLMNKEKLREHGTKNIVRAMEKTSVRRLVCLSVFGAGDSWDILPFYYRYLIIPLILRRVAADHNMQEAHVKKSRLDWVIVRPGNFVKGGLTGSYRHGFTTLDKSLTFKISHADVADFMLKQLADDTYVHKTPAISY